jgi:hypothetical protein
MSLRECTRPGLGIIEPRAGPEEISRNLLKTGSIGLSVQFHHGRARPRPDGPPLLVLARYDAHVPLPPDGSKNVCRPDRQAFGRGRGPQNGSEAFDLSPVI